MFPLSLSNLIPPAVSFALALMLTPVVRALARRWGFVAKPKTDRWHKNPTAMMGGVAIWLAVGGTYLFFGAAQSAALGGRGCGIFSVPGGIG